MEHLCSGQNHLANVAKFSDRGSNNKNFHQQHKEYLIKRFYTYTKAKYSFILSKELKTQNLPISMIRNTQSTKPNIPRSPTRTNKTRLMIRMETAITTIPENKSEATVVSKGTLVLFIQKHKSRILRG